ncbi:MAG: carboxypeptidase-like regulatory domain-containing protein, partial [Longimicrobiales bacterium]|nr:carboxypeptidase-like regulatory domain-containing protein [Longimicrobiales bacterium]
MLPVALAALAAGTAQAQTIHGVVSDSSSGAAVEGAFVVLIDAEGEAVARGLTGAAGRYRMTAPEVGHYRIRVDRIGYRSSTSARFELPEAGIRVDVQVAGQAVDLGGIQVRGEGRCALRPEEGEPTWRLWDEARKALEATRWTEARRELGFEIVRYERHLDPESLVVR